MLISIEGLDGASKGVSSATICKVLDRANISYSIFREPGGTPFAEQIRKLLKCSHDEIVSPETETLLFFASRTQSYINLILPALQQKQVVILDRCWWSTFAYQIYETLDDRLFWSLCQNIERLARIEQVLLLDVPPDVGIARAGARGELDRIESNHLSFFERTRRGYLELSTLYADTTCVINSDRPLESVQADVELWAQKLVETIQNTGSTPA